MRELNPEEWKNIVGLMKGTAVWNEVVRKYPELKTDDEIASRAKADGTYMKAPNGKPSNLTPRQWAQVRTKDFKDWFGDWELAAKALHVVPALKEYGFKSFDEARSWESREAVANDVIEALRNWEREE